MTVVADERVVVVGQGYVGLPLAIRAAAVGMFVIGFDVDHRKIHDLAAGRSYIDDVTDADVDAAIRSGRYLPSESVADLSGFTVAVITVPTPLKLGAPDLSHIESALDLVAPHLQTGATVVLESTTYPGTTDEVVVPRLEELSGLKAGIDFHVGYSPERIDPGNSTWSFENTPKVVSGSTDAGLDRVSEFYRALVDTVVPVSTTGAAELTKLLENTFRHVNIALVNELAIHARALEIDIWEVIAAASSKPFGFMPFTPGPGVGGHCLPIDPSYLAWRVQQRLGSTSRFVEIANDVNEGMPKYVVERVQRALNGRRLAVNGSRVLVLGLSYKRDTNDARETPSTGVVRSLAALGAEVLVHDDWCGPHEIDAIAPRVPLSAELLRSVEAVVIITDHTNVDYDLVLSNSPYVFDSRHCVSGDNVEYL